MNEKLNKDPSMAKNKPKQLNKVQPWDRQPGETDKAWQAFVPYRDLPSGKRSIKVACDAIGGTAGKYRQMELWSSKNQWVARVAAWDAHLDATSIQPLMAKQRAEMAERQIKLGREMQDKAREGLGLVKPKDLDPDSVSKLAKTGTDIERLAMGEPTEIQRHDFQAQARARLRNLFGDESPTA